MVRLTLFSLLLSFLSAAIAQAQRPVYRPSAAKEKHWTVRFSGSNLFGVSMSLKDLGTVNFTGSVVNQDGSISYVFNDGLITVADGLTTTADFIFAWDEQAGNLTNGTDPFGHKTGQQLDAFTLSRYGASSLDAVIEADSAGGSGWEIGYKYEFGKSKKRLRWGILGSFGIYNLDFSSLSTVNSQLLVDRQTFTTSQTIDYDANQPFYTGSPDGAIRINASQLVSDYDSAVGQLYTYTDPVTGEDVIASVPVNVDFEYDGVVGVMRLGPTLSLRLIDELYVELSGGVAAVYLDALVSRTSTIGINLPYIDGAGNALFGGLTTTDIEEHSDAFFGYYVEGLLRYQLSPRVGFHASVIQMGFGDQEEVQIGNSTYALDISAPTIGSAGVSIIF